MPFIYSVMWVVWKELHVKIQQVCFCVCVLCYIHILYSYINVHNSFFFSVDRQGFVGEYCEICVRHKEERSQRANGLFQLTHRCSAAGSGNSCYHFPSGNDILSSPTLTYLLCIFMWHINPHSGTISMSHITVAQYLKSYNSRNIWYITFKLLWKFTLIRKTR